MDCPIFIGNAELEKFKKTNKISAIVDIYNQQVQELSEIRRKKISATESWIYFPWSHTLLHTVGKEELQELRTNRNKNLITTEEQKILSECIPAIVGLSIGNAMAAGLSYSGIGATMKLAELDILSTANLNRVRAPLTEVGTEKILVTARQIYEINPYATLHLFEQGINEKNISGFLEAPQPSIIFEAIDDFVMKIKLRLAAREAGIPVIMMTSLGDSVLIDVERYDLDRKLPLFNGLISDAAEKILAGSLTENDKQKMAVELVGKQNVPERALKSLTEIGKTLIGRPQLFSTVTVASGIAIYVARLIALKQPMPSGRYRLAFQDIFS